MGLWNFVCLKEGLEAICLRLFTTLFGWSVDQVHVFAALVRAELKMIKSKKIHAQYT